VLKNGKAHPMGARRRCTGQPVSERLNRCVGFSYMETSTVVRLEGTFAAPADPA
jgi:hypothetical protein